MKVLRMFLNKVFCTDGIGLCVDSKMTLFQRRNVVGFLTFCSSILSQYFIVKCLKKSLLISAPLTMLS